MYFWLCRGSGQPTAFCIQKIDLHEIGVHLLVDDAVKVDFKISRLISATVEDDPEQVHD